MEDGGLCWRERNVQESPTFKGYNNLSRGYFREGQYPHVMLNAVDNICRSLESGDALSSSGGSALYAQELCGRIKDFSTTASR